MNILHYLSTDRYFPISAKIWFIIHIIFNNLILLLSLIVFCFYYLQKFNLRYKLRQPVVKIQLHLYNMSHDRKMSHQIDKIELFHYVVVYFEGIAYTQLCSMLCVFNFAKYTIIYATCVQ